MTGRSAHILASAAVLACANPPASAERVPPSDAAPFVPEPDVCRGAAPPAIQIHVQSASGDPTCDAVVTVTSESGERFLSPGAPPLCAYAATDVASGSVRVVVTLDGCTIVREAFARGGGCPSHPATEVLVLRADCAKDASDDRDAEIATD